jgi:hypothetical protein
MRKSLLEIGSFGKDQSAIFTVSFMQGLGRSKAGIISTCAKKNP